MDGNNKRENGPILIGNEFSVVRLRKISLPNGERLEIEAPKLGYSVQLDAADLESLTWQDAELFSGFLETPFGPAE